MAAFVRGLGAFVTMYPMLSPSALAGSLGDVEHVILFMQGWHDSLSTLTHILNRSAQKIGHSITTSAPWLVCEASQTRMPK
jgi:hypothetical protein